MIVPARWGRWCGMPLRGCMAATLSMSVPLGHLSAATRPQGSVTPFDRVEIRVSPANTMPQMRTIQSGDAATSTSNTVVRYTSI
jgi:hypothetical protein